MENSNCINVENTEANKNVKAENENINNEEKFEIPVKRSFFDIIADFFKLMVLGILKFTFIKIPKFICKLLSWENIKAVIKFFYSIWRALFWCTVWLGIVFAAWIAFGLKQFLNFWQGIGRYILQLLAAFANIIVANAGPIWFVIAIIGSIYGLVYMTLKKRATRKGVKFKGVFGFLHRKKTDTENI